MMAYFHPVHIDCGSVLSLSKRRSVWDVPHND